MRRLALCLLFLVSLGVAHAAAPPPQWLPRESWPGGKQYDPRLERTVRFWDTGVPAAQVLASLTAQTGVTLGFFPPHDDNARLCLNLYLNPAHPPTLRDLLVQLGWTMDCAWAVEGKGEQRRYLLLHTTLGDKAFEKIQQESDAAARRRGEEESKAEAERFAAVVAKLPELTEALRLTRDEALKRYRGKDDLLLLALLDPPRRAAAQLLASLSETDLAQIAPSTGISREWEGLSSQQQAWVTEAMKPALARLADEVKKGWHDADQQWDPFSGEWDLRVGLFGINGGFTINLFGRGRQPLANGRRRSRFLDMAGVILCPVSDGQQLLDEVELRHLLGEKVDEDETLMRASELDTSRVLQLQRALVEQQLSSLCHLSPEAADRLSALQLPVEADKEYALWQLQEAVAVLSGLHLISDHFAQPRRYAREVLLGLGCKDESVPNALLLLQANCVATSERENLRGGDPGALWTHARWEWSDAGDFLRFRSADRDAWRAAFLPADVVATLDEWLTPYLPRDPTTATSAAVPLDVRQTGALLARLDTIQRLWGGALAYGSPLDEAEQWRQSFRLAFAQVTHQWGPPWYLMLSGLDDAQWQQAQAEGLRIGVDFTLRPDLVEDVWGRPPRDWAEAWQGQVLRVGPPETRTTQRRIGQDPIDEWRRVEVRPEGAPPDQGYLDTVATQLTIHPDRLPHLVPAP